METPCDTPTEVIDFETGEVKLTYICPYKDCYTGYEDEMCRVCCGLGVDE